MRFGLVVSSWMFVVSSSLAYNDVNSNQPNCRDVGANGVKAIEIKSMRERDFLDSLKINEYHQINEGFQQRKQSNAIIVTLLGNTDDVNGDENQLSSSISIESEGKSSHIRGYAMYLKKLMIAPLFLSRALTSTFIPTGESGLASLPEGYISYVCWNAAQDLSTQLRSVLATQRVLEGMGIGREGATSLSATLNFIIRDGTGMAASLILTAMQSSNFRHDVKKWRMFADLIVDIGITLEVAASSMRQQFFLPTICIASMCKAMCGVAAGACGGAIDLFWAKQRSGDISDINAKFRAQSTITGGLGLVLSAAFANSLSKASQRIVWSFYSLLTMIHIYANMKCLKNIHFNTFNRERLLITAGQFFTNKCSYKRDKTGNDCLFLKPADVAQMESILPFGDRPWSLSRKCKIHFGYPLHALLMKTGLTPDEVERQLGQSYVIKCQKTTSIYPEILISLSSGINNANKTKAFFHGVLLQYFIQQISEEQRRDPSLLHTLETEASKVVDNYWDDFMATAESTGWDVKNSSIKSLGHIFVVSV